LDEGTTPVILEASISVEAFVLFDVFGNRCDAKPDMITAVIARREAFPLNAGNLVVLTTLPIVYGSIQARLWGFFSRLEIHKDLYSISQESWFGAVKSLAVDEEDKLCCLEWSSCY
jgi:hypothetical protein